MSVLITNSNQLKIPQSFRREKMRDPLEYGQKFQREQDMLTQQKGIKNKVKDLKALPKIAFGKDDWETYFGDIGKTPPLPASVEKILKSPCPFWKGKSVEKTHLLVLIPKTVNQAALTLNSLEELIKLPRGGGHAAKYRHYSEYVENDLGNKPSPSSYWALMTKEVIPGSRYKTYKQQCQMIADYRNKTKMSYEVPSIIEVATAILMHYVKTGERLYIENPRTLTRCCEKVDNNQWPVAIGGFSPVGLALTVVSSSYDDCGVASLLKL